MVEEGIQYRFADNKYYFCYYSLYKTVFKRKLTLHFIEYNQGIVGEINDFEVELDKDINIIKQLKDDVLKEYPIKQIPLYMIEVTIKFEHLLKIIRKRKHMLLLKHITKSIDFVCKSSGLGINNFTVPDYTQTIEKGIYQTQVSVYDKDAFNRLFVEHIAPTRILSEHVTILDANSK